MWRKRKLFRESNLMIFRFHCAWLAVDSFISAAKLRGITGAAAPPPPPPPPLDLLSQIHVSLWMDLLSLGSVVLIIVTCNCLPFSYSMSIFRRHISRQVLKIAFQSLQFWKSSLPDPSTRFVPSALAIMSSRYKNLATALIQVCRGGRVIRIFCTTIKTLRKCLVEVIVSWKTEFGLKEARF